MTSPTQRSLALLKKEGYLAAVTEHWNQFAFIRQDLYGFIDVVGIKETECGVLGVQTTSRGHIPDHLKKVLGIPAAKIWLACGNRIVLHGWSKKGKAGKRKLWEVFEQEITLSDFS